MLRLPRVDVSGLLRAARQELLGSALLVLANKQDVPGAATAMEISQHLKLHALKEISWQIQACSALTGAGLHEGLDWVAHTLRNKR